MFFLLLHYQSGLYVSCFFVVVHIPSMYICPELSDRCVGMFAGLLRYKVDFQSLQCDEFEDDLYDIDDY